MKRSYYVFSKGQLSRKDNTIYFQTEDGANYVPIENTAELFIFGPVEFNKNFIEILAHKNILLSYYNHYGNYLGTFYPRENNNSGTTLLCQAEAYLDEEKRIYIAKKFIFGAAENIKKILSYYIFRGKVKLQAKVEKIDSYLQVLNSQFAYNEILSTEAAIQKTFFSSLNTILSNKDFKFTRRSKQPPEDKINCLISFVNTMIYNYVLNRIYQTRLDPRIGYLHTTNDRDFSLNLDIAEIFKPVIGYRVIINLIKRKSIKESDFNIKPGKVYLNTEGKKKVLLALDQKLNSSLSSKRLGRKVSYSELILMETRKIESFVRYGEDYNPLIIRI